MLQVRFWQNCSNVNCPDCCQQIRRRYNYHITVLISLGVNFGNRERHFQDTDEMFCVFNQRKIICLGFLNPSWILKIPWNKAIPNIKASTTLWYNLLHLGQTSKLWNTLKFLFSILLYNQKCKQLNHSTFLIQQIYHAVLL